MNCTKCKGWLVIDEWNGWRWFCPHCEYVGRYATDEEIDEQHKEMSEMQRSDAESP